MGTLGTRAGMEQCIYTVGTTRSHIPTSARHAPRRLLPGPQGIQLALGQLVHRKQYPAAVPVIRRAYHCPPQ